MGARGSQGTAVIGTSAGPLSDRAGMPRMVFAFERRRAKLTSQPRPRAPLPELEPGVGAGHLTAPTQGRPPCTEGAPRGPRAGGIVGAPRRERRSVTARAAP